MKKRILLSILCIPFSLISQTNFSLVTKKTGSATDQPVVAFAKKGNYLYVASHYSNGFLKTFNVTNPAVLQLTDSISFPSAGDKHIEDMLIDGNYLWIAAGSEGLMVYDISNQATPSLSAHITSVMDGTTSRNISSSTLAKSGNYLLIESGWSGCMLLDVSTPSAPIYKDLITYTGVMNSIGFINSTTAVLTDGYDLNFIDCSTPTNLTKTTVAITGDPQSLLIDLVKNVVYVSSETISLRYLYSVDISSKQVIGTIDLSTSAGSIKDMSFKNTDTLLLGGDGGSKADFIALDVRIPASISVIEGVLNTLYGGSEGAILCDNKYVYSCSYDDLLVYKWGGGVGIEEIIKSTAVIFPVPAGDQITIKLDIPSNVDFDLFIHDTSGKLVQNQKVNFFAGISETIAVNSLSKGIYFIELRNKDKTLRNKIIVQ